jgi:hypothetical protein
MYQSDLHDVLPTFWRAAVILAVTPATSCSAERSFSGLGRMKTYWRSTMGQERLMDLSTMGQERLTDLSIINIERSFANLVMQEEQMDDIIDIFERHKNRDSSFFLFFSYIAGRIAYK